MEKKIIWPVEEKKNREGKRGKYLVNVGEEEQRKKRRKIFGEGKNDDGQIDRQTEFPLVDSTPSLEGVEQNECLLFSQSDHRSNTANFGSVAQGPYVQNIFAFKCSLNQSFIA